MSETAKIYPGEIYPNSEDSGHAELFKLDGRSAPGKLTEIYLDHPEKISEMPKGHARLIIRYLRARSELGEYVDIKLTAAESDLLQKAREKSESSSGKIRGFLKLVFSRKSNRKN